MEEAFITMTKEIKSKAKVIGEDSSDTTNNTDDNKKRTKLMNTTNINQNKKKDKKGCSWYNVYFAISQNS